MSLRCDAVFEGGGVKGIGFAGAIAALEDAGYRFENVVGTSAGAIAASLIAVGYTGREIEKELLAVDFARFREKTVLDTILGLSGRLLSLTSSYGIYKADYFESWLGDLLRRKGKTRFGDIRTGYTEEKYKYGFQAVASDLTDHRMLILPRDLTLFGIEPDDFEIAKAVRMSMSIPFYYRPFKLKDIGHDEHFVVDGGLLSNYPVWLLDDGTSSPPWPTFGMRFASDLKNIRGQDIGSLTDYSKALVTTMLEAGDNCRKTSESGDLQRTVMIPVTVKTGKGITEIKATDFDISKEESAALVQNGRRAVTRFLSRWDFDAWKEKYR